MFGSRRHHRPPNPPPLTAATANPNAATAAIAVFKRHESNASLSAAAAAAALRARPTTPIRVADVQTKRTLRRSASVASTGTSTEQNQGRSPLRRRDSSGSMTERTFRTPSPHRPASSGSAHRRSQSYSDDMPPVPTIPRSMEITSRRPSSGAPPASQPRKPNSLVTGNPPVRLASQKLASGEAPSWFGAARVGDLGSVRRTDPAMASPPSSPLQTLAREEDLSEGARPDSQASSINFSYPTRVRRGSANVIPSPDSYAAAQVPSHTSQVQPLAKSDLPTQAAAARQSPRGQTAVVPTAKRRSVSSPSDQTLVYDPNSRRMVRQADLLAVHQVQQAVLDASQRPTGSNKKKRAPQRAGSHLAAGTVGRNNRIRNDGPYPPQSEKVQSPRPAAQMQPQRLAEPKHPADAAPVQETQADLEEPAVKAIISSPRIEAKRVEQQRAQNAVELPQITIPVVSHSTPATLDPGQYTVRRQPSVVREESEPEEAEDGEQPQKVIADALDAVPGRQRMQTRPSPETRSLATPQQNTSLPSERSLGGRPTIQPHNQTSKTDSVSVSDRRPEPGRPGHGRAAHVSRERTHSSSPARQAHFGPIQEGLTVKHSPPPRSISPRKSALKHTSPPGGASPTGDTSEASGSVTQEPLVARKKSVRVSFDDGGNGTTGDAAVDRHDSPLSVNPPHRNRHSWLTNLGRGQDSSSFDDDMVMKPRPALPSFGSVRGRKPRDSSPDQPERPLVRPKGETRYASPLLPSPPLGSSNDHVLGAVLSKENGRPKEIAQHLGGSSAHNEPLPPVVTTVEGSGYYSDTSDTSSLRSSVFGQPEASFSTTVTEPRPDAAGPSQAALHKAPANGSTGDIVREAPPSQITRGYEAPPEPQVPTISVSQPTPLGTENKTLGQGFADVPGGFPDDESDQSAASATQAAAQAGTVSDPVENPSRDNQSAQPAVPVSPPVAANTSSDSDSDIYSDAYEDLSDIEGDGFQSLDAVVESPIQKSPRTVTEPEQTFKEISQERPRQEIAEPAPKLHTEASSATIAVETQPQESPQDDWEKAKAFWRSLTAEKRAQLEREAIEEAGIEADKDEVQPDSKPKKKKTVERRNSERKALAVHMAQKVMAQQDKKKAVDPDRSYMIKPGERWTVDVDSAIPSMRKTMRDEPQQQATAAAVEGSRLRKSMRSGDTGKSGFELRTTRNRVVHERPMSSPPVSMAPMNTGHRRSATQTHTGFGSAASAQPQLTRRGSTGSESSFKRSRLAKGQGFGFRHSLRPNSPPSVPADNHSSKRFSLRSLSPPSTGSPPSTQMRTTLRDQSAGRKTPTGIRMPSFGLSYGGGKKSDAKAPKNKASSRFADSSDEEGGGGGFSSAGFRSRFEDSSDDEPIMPIPALPKSTSAPLPSTAAAGHLRKESSIASTALPEELEESEATSQDLANAAARAAQSQPVPTVQPTTPRRTRSGRGQLLPASQTAPALPSAPTGGDSNNKKEGRRRGSFLSVLRHRKRESPAAAAPAKIGRGEVSESAARRDTRLERSVGQLERIRSLRGQDVDEEDDHGEGKGSPTKSPRLRLQKRGSSRRSEGGGDVASDGAGMAVESPVASPVTPPGTAVSPAEARNNLPMFGDLAKEDEHDDGSRVYSPTHIKHTTGTAATTTAAPSGNLGTRMLSSTGGSSSGGSGGGFLHLHPQRRASSMGMDAVASADGSVAGESAATTPSTPSKKKRFGMLRRVFGLGG